MRTKLCDRLPGARVEVLDRPDLAVTADVDGAFVLAGAPGVVSVLAAADGYQPTATLLGDAALPREVHVVPATLAATTHVLAGVPADSTTGDVLLVILGEGGVPLTGAQVSLLDSQGAAVAATQRRYFRMLGDLPTPSSLITATEEGLGAVVFLSVPPGDYSVRVEGTTYSFETRVAPVRAGVVTADFVQGVGTGGVAAVAVRGTVMLAGAPVAGADVEVTLVDANTSAHTTTSATGAFSVPMQGYRQRLDVTVRASGMTPMRTRIACLAATDDNVFNIHGLSVNEGVDVRLRAAGNTPLLADHALVLAAVFETDLSGTQPVVGARVFLGDSTLEPFYGAPAGTQTCGRGACTAGSCSAGQRCQDGNCVLDLPGMCGACPAGNLCGSGLTARVFPASGSPACYCLPLVADCLGATAACPAGAYCARDSAAQTQFCAPRGDESPGTMLASADVALLAGYANVPAGEQRFRATLDPRSGSASARVEPGVISVVVMDLFP
ncbi:MAG: carboxypeptidase regulatory-like domain-containing protein [Deltaproteobacteria bacterium]|nr:carboxypeptidase regulatory-like domain-containing protein [Deltaproteobacteria bacterium]